MLPAELAPACNPLSGWLVCLAGSSERQHQQCEAGLELCFEQPLGLFAAEQTRGLDLERSAVHEYVFCSPKPPFSRFQKKLWRKL